MTAKLAFEDLVLDKGAHDSPSKGLCVMEAIAYFRDIEHTDHPPCVSPVIGAFLRAWNDALDEDERQLLKPYIFTVVGTATTPEDEERRAWMATDWLARVFAPAWLDLAGLGEHAAKLRALPELTTDNLAGAAQETLSAARSAADSAAYSAARSAADSAADSAAYSAADSAARSAAYSAARSAAYSAAYSAADSAARSAAGKALAPTVAALEKEAFGLLDRLIQVGRAVEVAP